MMRINITMDNHIITILQNFEKPDSCFIKEKECLICLEPFDLESNKFVQLPCKCSNSVYHIDCIVKLLHSGENKNFCPHCKTNYEIPLENIQVLRPRQQVLPYIIINTQEYARRDQQITNFTEILMVHILTNSIMNIINIITSKICADNGNNPDELQVLTLFYFSKFFFNFLMFMYAKSHVDKIEDCLICSYTFQGVLFGLLIYVLTKIKIDNNSVVLLLNNIAFILFDFLHRMCRR